MKKWNILILTQPGRERFLARLQTVLKPQVEQYPDVEVLVRMCDPKLDLGTNRQAMIDAATGQYISQIDDDDLVPADFVSKIYPLLDGIDYVGFKLQMYNDGVKQIPTTHSLQYKEWNGDSQGWYRDISHVNPIRRDLALQVKMTGGHGEDDRWATGLRNLGIVKTEHFIDSVMYLYYWRSNKNDSPWDSAAVANVGPFQVAEKRPPCPSCGSTATGMGGGMKRCNQCGYSWS